MVGGPGPRTIPSVASVSSVFAVRGFSRKKYLQPILLCCNSRRPIATCLFSELKAKPVFEIQKFLSSHCKLLITVLGKFAPAKRDSTVLSSDELGEDVWAVFCEFMSY